MTIINSTWQRIHAFTPFQEVGTILLYRFPTLDQLFQAETLLIAKLTSKDETFHARKNSIQVTGSVTRDSKELLIHAHDNDVIAEIKEIGPFKTPWRECPASRKSLRALKT